MKKLLVVMLLLVSFVFAEVLIDNTLDMDPYVRFKESFQYPGAYNFVADDFTPTEDSVIEEITFWYFRLHSTPPSTDVTVEFYSDVPGYGPSPEVLGTVIIPYDNLYITNTGETYASQYVIYRCVVSFPEDEGFAVRESVGRHWVRITPNWSDDYRWYQICRPWEAGDEGPLYCKSNTTGWACDSFVSFMLITSEAGGTSVEETTWGQIKAAL